MDRHVEAVITAAGVTRLDVIGSSLGVPVAIEWAARHPDTVDRLVLYGGWVRGPETAQAPVRKHILGLLASNWGLGADVLTDIFAPDASAGTRAALANYQRQASSAATATRLLELCYRIDVTDSLQHDLPGIDFRGVRQETLHAGKAVRQSVLAS